MKSLHSQFARLFAAGLISAAAVLPQAATAGFPAQLKNLGGMGFHTLEPPPEEKIIREKATQLGGGQFTGLAVSGLEQVPGGHRIRYQMCDIYYSPAHGVFEVSGLIRDKYNITEGPWGGLGLPTSDSRPASDGIGLYSDFSGDGSIYWSPNTGPMVVWGTVRSVWRFLGAEAGALGYPTMGVSTVGPGQVVGDFQNNVIYVAGDRVRNPEYVGLTATEVKNALTNFVKSFLQSGGWFYDKINSSQLLEVSDTKHDFWLSGNRLIRIRFNGTRVNDMWEDDKDWTVDMLLALYLERELDGSTTLRLHMLSSHIEAEGWFVTPEGSLRSWAKSTFVARKLIPVNIPASVNVLSFKVFKDGGLGVYLKPGGDAALVKGFIRDSLRALAYGR